MKILPDSSVLIPYLASGHYAGIIDRARRTSRLLLCSVVAAEILAGARVQAERRKYKEFFGQLQRLGLMITPDEGIWHACGSVLSRYRSRYGAIEIRDHQNDALIVLTCCRYARQEELILLTENEVHLGTWLRFIGQSPGLRLEAVRRSI